MPERKTCGCGQPGRLYIVGLRCDDHQPAVLAGHPLPPVPDPTLTVNALRDRVLDTTRTAVKYGRATTDPRPPKPGKKATDDATQGAF